MTGRTGRAGAGGGLTRAAVAMAAPGGVLPRAVVAWAAVAKAAVAKAAVAKAAALLAAAGALFGVVVAGSSTAWAVDSSKGRPGYCPDGNGVTVVVDFQELGGGTITRCAVGDQPTGLAAIKNAGFEITGTQRWAEAFVCRIEGRPGPDVEACLTTPPPSAFWSYWHAPNGGGWAYSQLGLADYKPPRGSFEGWSFSLGHSAATIPPPRVAPVRPAAPPPQPSSSQPGPAQPLPGQPPASSVPSHPRPGTSGGTAGTGTTGSRDGDPAVGSDGGGPLNGAADPAAAAGSDQDGGTASSGPATPTGPASTPTSTADVAATAGGGPLPMSTVVGLLLVIALGMGAGLIVVRRRRSGPAGQ